jgi:hypothetical protein
LCPTYDRVFHIDSQTPIPMISAGQMLAQSSQAEYACEANHEDPYVVRNIRDEINATRNMDGSSDGSIRKCTVRMRWR